MQTNFHNTTNLTGEEIKTSHLKAHNQKVKVLELYNEHKKLSPSQVYSLYNDIKTPITSIRRCITNLMNEGKLEKMGEMNIGMYGKLEHYYKICE